MHSAGNDKKYASSTAGQTILTWWDIIVGLVVSLGVALVFARFITNRVAMVALTLGFSWGLTIFVVGYLTHGHWQVWRSSLVPIAVAASVLLFGLARRTD